MGTPSFAVPTLKKLKNKYNVIQVFTQPPRLSGRGMSLNKSPIHIFSEKNNLVVDTPVTLKDYKTINYLKKLNADLFIVVAYGLILPEEILKIPKHGCINGHASLLPKWRGAAPIQRAIEAGDKITGSTSMLMEKGLDTGPILHKRTISIEIYDDFLSIHDKLSIITSICIEETIQKILSNRLTISPQNSCEATYADKLVKTDGHINWKQNAFKIFNKVRAFKKFPGTYFYYNKKRINLIDGTPISLNHKLKSGRVLSVNKTITITCDKNSIFEISSIQKEGKKIMDVKNFLNGSKIKVGDFFE